jgi:hypothetical protein
LELNPGMLGTAVKVSCAWIVISSLPMGVFAVVVDDAVDGVANFDVESGVDFVKCRRKMTTTRVMRR